MRTIPQQPAAKADHEPTAHAPITLHGEKLGAEDDKQVAAEHGTAAAIRAVREEDRLVKFPVYRDLPPSGADLYVAEYLVSAPIFVDQVFLPQIQAFCSSVPSGQEELQRQQVDAPEAQASFGFLEVPIISSWDWHFVVV